MTVAQAAPTRPTDRIEELDLLRGFAVFGILVVNMTVFSGSAWSTDEFVGRADQLAYRGVELFAEGKFLNLFSFLFGVSFAMQMRRLRGRSDRPVTLYSRRLAALFVIGLIHGIFVAWVDVLQAYALLGMLLLLLSRLPQRMVVVFAILCFVLPVSYAVIDAGGPLSAVVAEWRDAYPDGTYAQLVSVRLEFWRWIYSSPSWYVSILGTEFVLFLLGMGAGRLRFFERLDHQLLRLRMALPWLAISATVLTVANLLFDGSRLGFSEEVASALQDRLSLLGALSLSGAYAATLIILVQTPAWSNRLAPLALAGRMALTNYVLQSVICGLVFYESGLGFYGLMGPAVGLGLTVLIFAVQLLISSWWLRVARFGPLEWLWRCATYGNLQPLRVRLPA